MRRRFAADQRCPTFKNHGFLAESNVNPRWNNVLKLRQQLGRDEARPYRTIWSLPNDPVRPRTSASSVELFTLALTAQRSHTSTRRFCSRPSWVSFGAIGKALPYPVTRDGTMPRRCNCSATACARSLEIMEFSRFPP
jgi:hypothetical protein